MLLTNGSQPTKAPPPIPVPFRISIGSEAHLARTGYPFSVPNEESFVLSAYIMNPKGVPPSGIADGI